MRDSSKVADGTFAQQPSTCWMETQPRLPELRSSWKSPKSWWCQFRQSLYEKSKREYKLQICPGSFPRDSRGTLSQDLETQRGFDLAPNVHSHVLLAGQMVQSYLPCPSCRDIYPPVRRPRVTTLNLSNFPCLGWPRWALTQALLCSVSPLCMISSQCSEVYQFLHKWLIWAS